MIILNSTLASEELPIEGIQHYQSLTGVFQWAISLSTCDDIHCATGKFSFAPRQGHLDRLQCICGSLQKYPDAAIWFLTGIPDYSHLHHVTFGLPYSVYGDSDEELPSDHACSKRHTCPHYRTTFEHANLMHDLTTGRYCTGILPIFNQTPF
jgi:hypothetical protein